MATWASLLTLIAAYQALQLGTGFDVWPIGEDRAWIDILQTGKGANAASVFWTINDRNPLSPWWYIGFRRLILGFDPGLLILRYVVGLALAIATYDLIRRVCGPGLQLFALACAMLVAVSMANGYFDQIYWNFEASLVCSLISIICYLHFQSSNRTAYSWYSAALVFWFVAIASYTIQCGALLAIAFLAFATPPNQERSLLRRSLASFRDSWPFGAVFLAFLLVWRTTARAAETYSMSPSLHSFFSSLKEGIWHYDLQLMVQILQASPHAPVYILGGMLVACGSVFFLWSRAEPESFCGKRLLSLFRLFVVVTCIAVPTIAVESSAALWAPGTRWRMIYQFTTPVFYLGLCLAACSVLGRLMWKGFYVCFGVLIASSVALSLAQNRAQVEITRSERSVRDKMFEVAVAAYASGAPSKIQFIVRPERGLSWYSSDTLSAIYAKTWFGRDDISFRVMPTLPLSGPYAEYWPLIFSEDSVGVRNAKLWAISSPYANTRILRATPSGIFEQNSVTPDDLAGFQARWDRKSGAAQFPVTDSSCVMRWSAEKEYFGRGLSITEFNDGTPFRWTIEQHAIIHLPRPCQSAGQVAVTVASALSEKNLKGLVLKIQDISISLTREGLANGRMRYVGGLPRELQGAKGPVKVELMIPSLDQLPGADRRFGVALESIEWTAGLTER